MADHRQQNDDKDDSELIKGALKEFAKERPELEGSEFPFDCLARFDFKYLMKPFYQSRRKEDKGAGQMPDPEDGKTNLKHWETYRTYKFDCDRCPLARAIYARLWNGDKPPEKRKYWCLKAFPKKSFRPDTMNSMATTWNAYNELNIKNEELNSLWEKFARNVSCIGNFALVPERFNSYRNNEAQDYWDRSLSLLSKGDAYLYGKNLWEKINFIKYINVFFLWDYIGNDGTPIELFERTGNSLFPRTEKEFQDFLTNVNRRIERRGIFMAAMLKIAVKYKDDYKKIINYLDNLTVKFKDLDEAMKKLPDSVELSTLSREVLKDARANLKPLPDNISGSIP